LRLPGGDWLLALPLEVALTGAWTLLFARRLPAASAVLAGLVVVVAARVGPPPALAALLPRAIDPVGPGISGFAVGVEALATAGVLLAVVALPGRDAHA
jgi:hypothetical protein